MRLTSAVIYVRDLDRAIEFYGQLLDLEPTITQDEAVLLSKDDRDHLVLRALKTASRVAPSVGVQFLVWTAQSREDLDRCMHALEALAAPFSTWNEGDITVVEGRDPDRTPILVTFPAGPGPSWTRLPTRVFSY
jgi:hypothetical protein